MFRVPLSNPAIKRTIRPLYAQHQATPWAGFLDPTWGSDPANTFDIFPGTVMTRVTKEVFRPYTGAAGQVPFGLSCFFVAPRLGVDEVIDTGSNMFSVWVGGDDSLFEVLAPAFDAAGIPALATNGSVQLLTGNAQGKLTADGATADNAIAELIDVVSADKITVRLRRPAGTGVTTP